MRKSDSTSCFIVINHSHENNLQKIQILPDLQSSSIILYKKLVSNVKKCTNEAVSLRVVRWLSRVARAMRAKVVRACEKIVVRSGNECREKKKKIGEKLLPLGTRARRAAKQTRSDLAISGSWLKIFRGFWNGAGMVRCLLAVLSC